MSGKTTDRSGQMVVVVGLMLSTLLMFFAFVVNIGMLVHAKINLQNAADLAAYAGAATQARQLNWIGNLNYEMRRQYKKFLFRYYVMGNMAQKEFPKTGPGPDQLYPFRPGPDAPPGQTYGVPATCVVFRANDNPCQVSTLHAITIPPPTFLDAVNDTLRTELIKIEQMRQNSCEAIETINRTLMAYWLWNVDPDLKALTQQYEAAGQTEDLAILKVIQNLSYGIGLYPRELLLLERIQTLNSYVNVAAERKIGLEKIRSWQTSDDAPAYERQIQAFMSAYYTLGPHVFKDESAIQMDELMAEGPLLKLDPIRATFDVYSVALEKTTSAASGAIEAKDCAQTAFPMKVENLPVGVKKDKTTRTYYAVHLRAKARLLFSPFGDVELSAYAAAQPFGSRIGPQLSERDFVSERMFEKTCGATANPATLGRDCARKIPNLPLSVNDSAASGGWLKAQTLGAFYQKFSGEGPGPAPGQSNLPPSIGWAEMERAYKAAMLPNPWEEGQYNILNDLGGSAWERPFDTPEGTPYPEVRTVGIWAPLFSRQRQQAGEGTLEDRLIAMTHNLKIAAPDPAGSVGNSEAKLQEFRENMKRGLTLYVQRLKEGKGEVLSQPVSDAPPANATFREGFNITYLNDPFSAAPSLGGAPRPIRVEPATLVMTEPGKVRSGWAAFGDKEMREQGRTGYSVKMVSFRSLLSAGGKIANPPSASEGDEELDFSRLPH